MRRITVELDKQTRDGDGVIHLVTNLPKTVGAQAIADVYRLRWEEETGFYYVTTTLNCELASIGTPQAALFLFCIALMAFNIRQVVFAALYAEHNEVLVKEFSHQKLSVEVSSFSKGMLVSLDDEYWSELLGDTPEDLAHFLRNLSRTIDIKRYLKSHRGPKKKVDKPPRNRRKTHVSTGKILKMMRMPTP